MVNMSIMNSTNWTEQIESDHTGGPVPGTDVPEAEISVPAFVPWTYFALRIVWAMLAVMGNALTIIVVQKFDVFHTCSNYLVCSLAMSDMITALMVPLTIVHQRFQNLAAIYIPVCLTEQTLNVLSTAGNLVNIMYMTVDRWLYIARPLRYPSIVTPGRTAALIGTTWVFYISTTVLTMLFASRLKVGVPCKYSVYIHPVIYQLVMTPQFLIMLILTIGFNLAIAKIAHKQQRAVATVQPGMNASDVVISRRTLKIARMLGAVLGSYLLCIMPQYIMTLTVHRMGNVTARVLVLEKVTLLMYWASSWVNPLIYVWRLKHFRVAFKKVLFGKGNLNNLEAEF